MVGVHPSVTAAGSPPAASAEAGRDGPRWGVRSVRRRRVLPYVSLGAVLVVGSVVVFALAAARLGERVAVLAVARPVAVGEVIEAGDVREVSVAADAELGLVPAAEARQVVGRTAAVTLVPGMLVVRSLVGGEAGFPPPGQVVASLALKPGQFPEGLPVGASVLVFVRAEVTAGTGPSAAPAPGTDGSTAPAGQPVAATVVGVSPAADGQGGAVVTVLLPSAAGSWLAAAPADGVVLMQTTPRR